MLNFSDATAQFRRPRRSISTLYAIKSRIQLLIILLNKNSVEIIEIASKGKLFKKEFLPYFRIIINAIKVSKTKANQKGCHAIGIQ